MTAAIVLGVLSLLMGATSFFVGRSDSKRLYEQQMSDTQDMYEQQHSDAVAATREAQNWNSEVSQANRLRAAGRNPDLVDFNSSSTPAAATPGTPSMPAQERITFDTVQSAFDDATNSTLSYIQSFQDLQSGALDIDAKNISIRQEFEPLAQSFLNSFPKDSLTEFIKNADKSSFDRNNYVFFDRFANSKSLSKDTREAFYQYFNNYLSSEAGQTYLQNLRAGNVVSARTASLEEANPLSGSYGELTTAQLDYMQIVYDSINEGYKSSKKRSQYEQQYFNAWSEPYQDGNDTFNPSQFGVMGYINSLRSQINMDVLVSGLLSKFQENMKDKNLIGSIFFMRLLQKTMNPGNALSGLGSAGAGAAMAGHPVAGALLSGASGLGNLF